MLRSPGLLPSREALEAGRWALPVAGAVESDGATANSPSELVRCPLSIRSAEGERKCPGSVLTSLAAPPGAAAEWGSVDGLPADTAWDV